MIRSTLAKNKFGNERGFRWRGEEISRMEAFSDAVFAFAVTLLVVSLEVPKTFEDMIGKLFPDVIAFGLSFIMLYQLWFFHYKFFRRYGLNDTYTTVLNGFLLFMVLTYVYPLKFLTSLLIHMALELPHTIGDTKYDMIKSEDIGRLMLLYSVGYLIVMTVFALLYYHAYRKRSELELTALELFDTKKQIFGFLLLSSFGGLSALFVLLGYVVPAVSFFTGVIYILLAPIVTIYYRLANKRRRKLETQSVPKVEEKQSTEAVQAG